MLAVRRPRQKDHAKFKVSLGYQLDLVSKSLNSKHRLQV